MAHALGQYINLVPFGVAASPDGTFWWAQDNNPHVGFLKGDCIYQLLLPGGIRKTRHVAAAPDGTLWFTSPPTHKIVHVSKMKSQVYDIGLQPSFLVADTNKVWFVEAQGTQIGSLTDGRIQLFQVPGAQSVSGISLNDHDPIVTDSAAGALRVMRNNTWKSIFLGPHSEPRRILTDSAGNIHVLDAGNNRILKYDSELKPLGLVTLPGHPNVWENFAINDDGYWLTGGGIFHVGFSGRVDIIKTRFDVRDVAAFGHSVVVTEANWGIAAIRDGKLREYIIDRELTHMALDCKSDLLPEK